MMLRNEIMMQALEYCKALHMELTFDDDTKLPKIDLQ